MILFFFILIRALLYESIILLLGKFLAKKLKTSTKPGMVIYI